MYLTSQLLPLTLAWLVWTTQAQYYAITGVQTGRGQNGTRPLRRNIYDLQNDQPALSLYLQGLTRLQEANQNDPLSWLQVAGIHGRPYIPWNNIQYVPGAPPIGFCTHSSPLFATWHRPYLVLIEQVLATHIQDIARQYPPSQRSTYQAAADNFRLPYWDWASQPELPPITTTTTIQVISPEGPRTIRNPLYSFRFPSLNQNQFPPSQDGGLSTYPETTRQSVAGVNARLRAEGFQRRVWQSFARSFSFNAFSTSSTPGTSIESIHNAVHGDINAHMGSLAYSAFDPIFWLHHTNVDRLTALYQCINPTRWLSPMPEPQGTFTIRQFQLVSGNTQLTPFTSNSGGALYTSDTARYLPHFGYSYPEIIDWNQTPSQLQAACTAHLNRLYNPGGSFFRMRMVKRGYRRREEEFVDLKDGNGNKTEKETETDTETEKEEIPVSSLLQEAKITKNNQLRTWTVSVKVSKFDYPSPFIIRTFIGKPSSDPQKWFEDVGCVGSVYVQQPSNTTDVDGGGYFKGTVGSQQRKEVVVHDEFDLEARLLEVGVDGQDVDEVRDLLERELTWRVQTPDNKIIPVEEIKSLKVSVAEEIVTLARSVTELPTYKNRKLHPEITRGKVGGFRGTAAG